MTGVYHVLIDTISLGAPLFAIPVDNTQYKHNHKDPVVTGHILFFNASVDTNNHGNKRQR
ncbi:hypothetical protein ACFSKU_07810 [Pontibacter silvestris]|uniref:Uncharacterized protein n=1 Tax=Pontibacter silvestris TaxID=2305183 RepID=A0ABW4WX79_9BACT|nr:hypothetical protein [Pontibacter silvestris]